MKPLLRILSWPVLLIGSLIALNASGETFYCEDNKQLKCLGFEEKIVDRNAVCFDPMKCDQDGFVCKSELNAMADENETLNNKYNELANTHNKLIEAYKDSTDAYESLQRCITIATTLEEAQACI